VAILALAIAGFRRGRAAMSGLERIPGRHCTVLLACRIGNWQRLVARLTIGGFETWIVFVAALLIRRPHFLAGDGMRV
jgi:hypothetical protein